MPFDLAQLSYLLDRLEEKKKKTIQTTLTSPSPATAS